MKPPNTTVYRIHQGRVLRPKDLRTKEPTNLDELHEHRAEDRTYLNLIKNLEKVKWLYSKAIDLDRGYSERSWENQGLFRKHTVTTRRSEKGDQNSTPGIVVSRWIDNDAVKNFELKFDPLKANVHGGAESRDMLPEGIQEGRVHSPDSQSELPAGFRASTDEQGRIRYDVTETYEVETDETRYSNYTEYSWDAYSNTDTILVDEANGTLTYIDNPPVHTGSGRNSRENDPAPQSDLPPLM